MKKVTFLLMILAVILLSCIKYSLVIPRSKAGGVKDLPLDIDSVKVACYTYNMGASTLDSINFQGHTYLIPLNDSIILPAHAQGISIVYSTIKAVPLSDSVNLQYSLMYMVNVGPWNHWWLNLNPAKVKGHWSGYQFTWPNRMINTDSLVRIELANQNPFYIPPYTPLP